MSTARAYIGLALPLPLLYVDHVHWEAPLVCSSHLPCPPALFQLLQLLLRPQHLLLDVVCLSATPAAAQGMFCKTQHEVSLKTSHWQSSRPALQYSVPQHAVLCCCKASRTTAICAVLLECCQLLQ